MRTSSWVALVFGVAAMTAATSRADEITVGGNPYKNVLITKTASFYYIQFPDEGRTVSVPIAEADASSVKINNDPFYRNPLRETFSKNKTKRAAGGMKDVDPAFKAAKGEKIDTGDPLKASGGGKGGGGGGGGGKGGFGVPRTQLEQTLTNFGFQFTPGPGNNSAIANRQGSSLELQGSPDNLTGIIVKASGPVAAVDGGAQQLNLLLMQLRPAGAPALTQAMTDAKAKGSGSGSAGGVNVSVNRKVDGENANLEVRITAG